MIEKQQIATVLLKIWHVIVVAVNVAVASGLIVSAYSCMFTPEQLRYGVVVVMTFPAWLLAAVVLFVADLVFWRRTAMIMGVAMLICTVQINDYCPLNIPRGAMNNEERERSFTLMTYNVMQFINQERVQGQVISNPQIDYIIATSPDVVCLEESMQIARGAGIQDRITGEQLESLHNIYPYIFTTNDLSILSKFPVEPVETGYRPEDFRSGQIRVWRLHIPDPTMGQAGEVINDSTRILGGRIVNVFQVHLRSMAYSPEQRTIFREATEEATIHRSELQEIRRELLPTLFDAAEDRAKQTKLLVKYLEKFGGETAIVCGDFNDVVGCHSLYLLRDKAGMKSAYTEAGFGPMITYNANNFYFRIDHILYRGAIEPYSVERDNILASDHYPLMATFLLK